MLKTCEQDIREQLVYMLTLPERVTNISANHLNWVTIDSDNGLSPVGCLLSACTYLNQCWLIVNKQIPANFNQNTTLESMTNPGEILIRIHTAYFVQENLSENAISRMASISRPGYVRLKIHIEQRRYTVKPVCNDHLYNEVYHLWFIQ